MLVRLGLALCAATSLVPGAAFAQGALGANFNEHYEDVDYRDLQRSDTKWVRLFLQMPELDRGPAAEHGAIKTILDVGKHGYKTILTFKFAYIGVQFPEVGGETYQRDIARLDAVLPLLMGKVDILVIGNEPFIESRPQDRNANFNAYYEGLAKRVIDYRAKHCATACKTQLYMGALKQLERPEARTAATERWMEYARLTPEISGVTIHPHVASIEASKAYLDYILPRMRPDQKFLVTEFSIVRWWQQHLTKPIPAAFANTYQLPPETQNWQLIKAALDAPFDKAKWDDFLSQSPWFESRKHYLANQMKMYRDTGKLAVATYAFKQASSMSRNFGPTSLPWLLNSVVAARTVKRNADGSAAFNYAWIDDYKALAKQ